MNIPDKPPAEKRTAHKRTITVTLSIPAVISSIIALCIGLTWVFFLGIILGRGHTPEARIPELERIMPQAQTAQAPQVVTPAPHTPAPPAPTAQETAEAQRNTVIDQGDLGYRESLKPSPPPRGQRQNTKPGQPGASQKPQAGAKPETAGGKSVAGKPADNKPSGKEQAFNYVYQVAAYKDAPSSDKMAEKLKKTGIQARTQKEVEDGKTWFKTVVDFRGTPDDTNGLRTKLSAHGIKRLILKSKVPTK